MNVLLAGALAVLVLTNVEDAEEIKIAGSIVEAEGNGSGRSVEIMEDARKAETITVTSERCDFDRTDGVVLFEGNAALEYSSGYTLAADRLFVYFVGSNEFDRVVCEGNVAFTNESRVGMCDRAVFHRAQGEITMFGGPDGSLARIAEQGADEIAGRRIRFWVDTEQAEVSAATLTFERGGSSTNGVSNIERKLKKRHQAKREEER